MADELIDRQAACLPACPDHDSAPAVPRLKQGIARRGQVLDCDCLRMKLQAATSSRAHSAIVPSMRCFGPATATAKVSLLSTSDDATAHTSSTFSPSVRDRKSTRLNSSHVK